MAFKLMLDQLQMTIRSYERIAPNAGSKMTHEQADELTHWLDHQVCEIVASLLARPGFRCRVRWPVERLTGEMDCTEREAVLAVDDELVRYAKALCAIAQTDEIRRQLLRLNRYLGVVDDGDQSALDPSPEKGSRPKSPLGLTFVEFLGSRPWRDLASAWDYFRPVSQFNLKEPDHGQFAEFLPYFNRRLRIPGDFVTRCLEIRVDTWRTELQKFWVRCDTARQNGEVDLGAQWDDLNRIRSEFNNRFESLRLLCCSGQTAKVRDSCVALLQIYAGFRQNSDLSWLGPAAKMMVNVADIPYRVSHRHEWDVPERAAAALVDITDLVRRPQTPDDLIEEMKATKRFVLVEEQRTGFLDGQSINQDDRVNWHGQGNVLWELIWTLADRALVRRTVDGYCLSNPNANREQEPPTAQAVKDRRSKLKTLITPELNELIIPGAASGAYRLQLDPDEICLLGWFNEERLEVLPPTVPRY